MYARRMTKGERGREREREGEREKEKRKWRNEGEIRWRGNEGKEGK